MTKLINSSAKTAWVFAWNSVTTLAMQNSNFHLVKAAFHTQFKNAMENCGVSADYYFKRVVQDHLT